MIIAFTGWIDKGAFIFDQTAGNITEALAPWDQERVTIKFEKLSNRRTLPQNRLIWKTYQGAIEHFAELSPFSKDDLHEYFKREYCPTTEIILPGGEVTEIKSTKRLTVEQMSEFIEKVLAHLANWGWGGE